MGHGGARPGSGRKALYYHPETGEPLKCKRGQIPEVLTEKDIQDAVDRKLKPGDKSEQPKTHNQQ